MHSGMPAVPQRVLAGDRSLPAQGAGHADANHITTMVDCMEMCATCLNFMLRESPRHHRTCEVCAEFCDACAKSCTSFQDDDEMRRCAAECQRCAELCREMV